MESVHILEKYSKAIMTDTIAPTPIAINTAIPSESFFSSSWTSCCSVVVVASVVVLSSCVVVSSVVVSYKRKITISYFLTEKTYTTLFRLYSGLPLIRLSIIFFFFSLPVKWLSGYWHTFAANHLVRWG